MRLLRFQTRMLLSARTSRDTYLLVYVSRNIIRIISYPQVQIHDDTCPDMFTFVSFYINHLYNTLHSSSYFIIFHNGIRCVDTAIRLVASSAIAAFARRSSKTSSANACKDQLKGWEWLGWGSAFKLFNVQNISKYSDRKT